MNKNFNLKGLILGLVLSIAITNTGFCAEIKSQDIKTKEKPVVTETKTVVQYETTNPLELVANPQNYLNKNIKITALFDKFSTIGLDYPPIKRSSKDYITFIIKRPDAENKEHSIPLSELKFIIKRDKAEKLIELESGDKIEIKGTVFSAALGDPWVDVDEVKVLESKMKTSESKPDSAKKNKK